MKIGGEGVETRVIDNVLQLDLRQGDWLFKC